MAARFSKTCRIQRSGAVITRRRSTGTRCPEDLEVSATADDGELMAVRHRRDPVEGIQFHPESILTPDGPALLRNFLDARDDKPRWRGYGTGTGAADSIGVWLGRRSHSIMR